MEGLSEWRVYQGKCQGKWRVYNLEADWRVDCADWGGWEEAIARSAMLAVGVVWREVAREDANDAMLTRKWCRMAHTDQTASALDGCRSQSAIEKKNYQREDDRIRPPR